MARSKETDRRVFELQCEICKAVAHPLRLEIIDLLSRREMPASTLIRSLETSKANVSKHVHQLVKAGVVKQRREGRRAYYRLTYPEIHEACSIMRSILFQRLRTGAALAQSAGAQRQR